MRVEVRPLYLNGRSVPKQIRDRDAARTGDLTIVENRNESLGRLVTVARLVGHADSTDLSLLPDLTDVHIVWLAAKTMRLRGNELVDNVWYAQTWEVRVL